MPNKQHKHRKNLLKTHKKRLQILEQKAARYGINLPPEDQLEIDEIREKIANIEVELANSHRSSDKARPDTSEPHADRAARLLDNRRDNLPAPTTPLIGRESKVKEVLELLQNVRLLTLTGPGGTGKTRLALEVATILRDDFDNDICWVELASINEDSFVKTIADTLGVLETGGQSLLALLKNTLRDRRMLLVLDNFEQIVKAGPLVSELLASASGLKVLVTSRAVLKLTGEHEFIVPPLSLPDQKRPPALEELAKFGAIHLFVERAQAAKRDFSLTTENAAAITKICARLDGLPLAIVLAAARIKMFFTPEALLAGLERRLPLLAGGARDLPERQQTLRNTIDWSYKLLDKNQQALFRRLAVFAGGCTLEAAAAVLSPKFEVVSSDQPNSEPRTQKLELDVLEGLVVLVDESLLRQIQDAQGKRRFTMLETIREYAQDQLAASRQEKKIRQRHAIYYLELAETAAPKLITGEQTEWFERLELEHNNLREALRWSETGSDDGQVPLRMVAALWRFWDRHCHLDEAKKWQDPALNSGGTQPPHLRAQALLGASAIARDRGELDLWNRYITEARDLFETRGDKAGKTGKAEALVEIGYLALYNRDYGNATRPIEEGLALARELGDNWLTAWALDRLGDAARCLKNSSEAIARYAEALELFRSANVQDNLGMACSLHKLGDAAARQRDTIPQAVAFLQESTKGFYDLGDQRGVAECLEGWAFAAQTFGYLEQAARLLGAAEELRDITQTTPQHADRDELDDAIAKLGDAYAAAWEAGRAMSPEQAIDYALELFPSTEA